MPQSVRDRAAPVSWGWGAGRRNPARFFFIATGVAIQKQARYSSTTPNAGTTPMRKIYEAVAAIAVCILMTLFGAMVALVIAGWLEVLP